MEETCWIKDERGRFRGRRPGCKMEKGGVTKISDKAPSLSLTLSAGEDDLEKEAKAHGKSVEDYKKEKRAMDILTKPQSQWTEEDKQFLKDYGSIEANPTGNPVDASASALTGPIAGILKAILGNIAMDISMDELMKYAEEKIGKWGAIGAQLALILGIAKGKYNPKAAAKAAGAGAEKKAIAGAGKNAAEESAKAKEKLGKIYDETKNYKYKPGAETQKKTNKVNTGDVSAKEANTVSAAANKAGSSVDIRGYKTEASQAQIEHSMNGHARGDTKRRINRERAAHGETVRPRDYVDEEKRVGPRGTYNESLKKQDYQKIEEYRKQAVDNGTVEFNRKKRTVDYLVKQGDGVIYMRYKIDPVNKKLTFETMWKEGFRTPKASK
ncbi:MAG: hypothetical protein H7843_00120 [Nitrospirota bacterium]